MASLKQRISRIARAAGSPNGEPSLAARVAVVRTALETEFRQCQAKIAAEQAVVDHAQAQIRGVTQRMHELRGAFQVLATVETWEVPLPTRSSPLDSGGAA